MTKNEGKVVAISFSKMKGVKKQNLTQGELIINHGLKGDAHADGSHRQLSLLGQESIETMRAMGADVNPGDFAENITTSGINLFTLPVGTKLRIGEEIILEVTQIGKECHAGCAIHKQVGKCVMPKQGIFCRIITGGIVRPDDPVIIIE